MSLWLCLRFNQLPLQCLDRSEERPIVVLARQRVVRLNDCAAALGIKEGMGGSTVRALAADEPVKLLERDETAEQRCLSQLCCWAYSITPTLHPCPPLQGALNPTVLASTLAHFSGHAHFFQATLFKQRRFPHQFIVGNSGTALYSWSLLPGAVVNQTVHLPPSANVQGPANEALVRSMTNMIEFGYGVVQHDDGTGWRFSLRSPAGEEVYATTIQ